MLFSKRKKLADFAVAWCEKRGIPESPFNIVTALASYELVRDDKLNPGREAKDGDGNEIIWHMFFIDKDGDPMAIIERAGVVKYIPASWVQFI